MNSRITSAKIGIEVEAELGNKPISSSNQSRENTVNLRTEFVGRFQAKSRKI